MRPRKDGDDPVWEKFMVGEPCATLGHEICDYETLNLAICSRCGRTVSEIRKQIGLNELEDANA